MSKTAEKGGSDRRKTIKTTHSLGTPFAELKWPQIEADHQATILDLLCQLLGPLGQYRRTLPKSKGKRGKQESKKSTQETDDAAVLPLPVPEVASHVVIGLSAVYKQLEKIIAGIDDELTFRTIFLDQSAYDPIVYETLRESVAAASRVLGPDQTLWLVALPVGSSTRLNGILDHRFGICFLSSVAPGSKALMEFIKTHVAPVEPLEFGPDPLTRYRSVQIQSKSVEIEIKPSKAERRRKAQVAQIEEDKRSAPQKKHQS